MHIYYNDRIHNGKNAAQRTRKSWVIDERNNQRLKVRASLHSPVYCNIDMKKKSQNTAGEGYIPIVSIWETEAGGLLCVLGELGLNSKPH